MKSRLAAVLAGITILVCLGSVGGCGASCTQDEITTCGRVESGEAAAEVFDAVNPTIIREKLERCATCADGPGVRKALEAAKRIEGVLKGLRG
jgi:hypothetical protein